MLYCLFDDGGFFQFLDNLVSRQLGGFAVFAATSSLAFLAVLGWQNRLRSGATLDRHTLERLTVFSLLSRSGNPELVITCTLVVGLVVVQLLRQIFWRPPPPGLRWSDTDVLPELMLVYFAWAVAYLLLVHFWFATRAKKVAAVEASRLPDGKRDAFDVNAGAISILSAVSLALFILPSVDSSKGDPMGIGGYAYLTFVFFVVGQIFAFAALTIAASGPMLRRILAIFAGVGLLLLLNEISKLDILSLLIPPRR